MARFCLTVEQQKLLRAQLCSTEDVKLYRRTFALLEVDQGRSPAEVSRALGVSCSSVYNWVNAFKKLPQPGVLTDHRGNGRPSLWTGPLQTLLQETLGKSPAMLGYQVKCWTVPLLQAHLETCSGKCVSAPTIRRKLHQLGYVWRHFGYGLTGNPGLEEKPPKI